MGWALPRGSEVRWGIALFSLSGRGKVESKTGDAAGGRKCGNKEDVEVGSETMRKLCQNEHWALEARREAMKMAA